MTHLADDTFSIPSHLAHARTHSKNIKFVVAGGLLLLLVVVLLIYSTVSTGAYYLTVAEVKARSHELAGQRIRVNGTVVEGSETWLAQDLTLKFAIRDDGAEQLPIIFYGPRPDNFQRAASAIVEGELLADGTFVADSLLLKCPSRYEEEPEEIFARSTR